MQSTAYGTNAYLLDRKHTFTTEAGPFLLTLKLVPISRFRATIPHAIVQVKLVLWIFVEWVSLYLHRHKASGGARFQRAVKTTCEQSWDQKG